MKASVSSGVPGTVDPKSLSTVTVDLSHHEIHDGNHFVASHYATGKNDGDTIMIVFKTPNTAKRIHVFCEAFASGQAYFYILEGPTFTDNTGVIKYAYEHLFLGRTADGSQLCRSYRPRHLRRCRGR